MKRFICLLFLVLLSVGVFAQERLDAISPKDPRSMAMGGAFVAMSEGYQSLFGNPASFADKSVDFTIVSLNPWIYIKPTTENIDMLQSAFGSSSGDSMAMVNSLSGLIVDTGDKPGNGLGAGASFGLGWVGKGLAIGLVGTADSYLKGPNLLGARGTIDGQIAAIVGIGIPLRLGPLVFNVGGDLRPFVRMTGAIGSEELMGLIGSLSSQDTTVPEADPFYSSIPVFLGFGMAMDLGASIDLGSFLSVGLALRDISAKQNYAQTTLGELIAQGSSVVGDQSTEKNLLMLPNITLGASIRPIPEGLKKIVDVVVIMELQDPINVALDKSSVWNLLHIGAEAEVLGGLFKARAGVNKGWLSFGAGIDLLIAELNVAIFTEEMGRRPGDSPRTGVSAELAIRF